MDQFDFGLSDIMSQESGGRSLARGGAGFLLVLFALLSGLTTFLFFSQYAAGVAALFGDAAPFIAGLIGYLTLDVACLVWTYVRSRAASSGAQMTIALVASVGDLILALATSGLYVVLSTTLETGVRTAAGELSQFGLMVNHVGVAVITLALIGNFAAVFGWQVAGADTRAAAQSTQLRAVVTAARFRVDQARTEMALQRTMDAIGQELPAAADRLAAVQSRQYVTTTMRQSDPSPDGNGRPQ